MRKLPYSAFVLVIGIVALCGIAIARMSPRWLAGRAETEIVEAVPAGGGDEHPSPLPAAARCPGCGVVESIQPLAGTANQPGDFEFTVRMRDGSTRVSRTVGRASWRVGDRIILMSGARKAPQ